MTPKGYIAESIVVQNKRTRDYHSIPTDNSEGHVCRRRCWCRPKIDHLGDTVLIVHDPKSRKA